MHLKVIPFASDSSLFIISAPSPSVVAEVNGESDRLTRVGHVFILPSINHEDIGFYIHQPRTSAPYASNHSSGMKMEYGTSPPIASKLFSLAYPKRATASLPVLDISLFSHHLSVDLQLDFSRFSKEDAFSFQPSLRIRISTLTSRVVIILPLDQVLSQNSLSSLLFAWK